MTVVKWSLIILLLFLNCGMVWATDYTQEASCMGAWLMDIDEDPITDSSGEGHTGALESAGNPDFTTSGQFGGCYDFSSDVISIANVVWGDTTNDIITVLQYVNADTTASSHRAIWRVAAGGANFAMYHSSTNKLQYYDGAFHGSQVVTAPQWYHIAFTQTAQGTDKTELYINGASNVTTGDGRDCVTETVQVGGDNWSQDFDGRIDEFAVFNVVLTSTQINDIMDNGLVGAAPPAASIFQPIVNIF